MGSDFRRFVGRRVLVFTDAMTFDGTLLHDTRDSLALHEVEAVSPTGERRPVDGQAVVPLLRIEWVQVP